MLNKNQLKNGIKKVLVEPSTDSTAAIGNELGDEIISYLDGASVGITNSSVTFPTKNLIPIILRNSLLSASAGSPANMPNALTSALMSGTVGALGNLDGIPIPPGTTIVSEVGTPFAVSPLPILLAAFQSNDKTVEQISGEISSAVHSAIKSITFITIEMVPSPAGPVPTPFGSLPIV